MKKMLMLFLVSVFCGSLVFAETGKFGIEVAPGGPSLGGFYYTEGFGLGAWTSIKSDNAPLQTSAVDLGFWAEIRTKMEDALYFAYGLDLDTSFGKVAGTNIDSSFGVGPFIGLEKGLSKNFEISVWTEPVYVSRVKMAGSDTITTYKFFNSHLSFHYYL